MRRKKEERPGVFLTGAETIQQRPVASSCEPMFEKRARFGAFHAAPNRIHHATAHGSIAFVAASRQPAPEECR